ncbi:MAG: molecular chaperone HtpG [Gammaproteobacteria bacterium RIFCSPHIGHO2_12_FULL_45_9]|nr:MAG: molecular chaperone HtpG [Gammaproteobacteria bacterium RIFCSPHIGHO2_12_FULL_45_9]
MTEAATEQTLRFEAEVSQLLRLVTHSLYSNKEIFLRELISNASDAADKLRYKALTDAALYEGDSELKIWVDIDKDARTITVRDNGIGMTRDEVVHNLGTIAQSGTKAFLERLKPEEMKESGLIGQFGVGFYSAFVVAERVVVRTRAAGMQADQGVYWESAGEGEFTVKNIEKPMRGTEVVLFLKKEDDQFLSPYELRRIITKYSDHILLPIVMEKEVHSDKKEDENAPTVTEPEVVNRANALWTLPKADISDEDYQNLYKHIGHDFENPLAWAHNKVEGNVEYTSLLYVPSKAPFDLWHREAQRGLKLYVKRVFIMDDAEHLMPFYLRFVKGIVDCNDLPLNVSREILQSSEKVEKIKSGCTKRILSLLEQMAEQEADKYATFWAQFGNVIKEGPAEDYANKDRIAALLRFNSTQEAGKLMSLKEYVSRMKEGQDKIYYLIADNESAAQNSPLLEVFRQKGLEVILMHDRIDEWLMSHLTEFEGKKFQAINKGQLDLGTFDDADAKAAREETSKQFEDCVTTLQKDLEERVKSVRVTDRLTDSPACVVFDDFELSGHMQRILAQAGQSMPSPKPIFEINPKHPLILRLKSENNEAQRKQWASLLLDQALLAEGETLPDPAAFVKSLNQMWVDMTVRGF